MTTEPALEPLNRLVGTGPPMPHIPQFPAWLYTAPPSSNGWKANGS